MVHHVDTTLDIYLDHCRNSCGLQFVIYDSKNCNLDKISCRDEKHNTPAFHPDNQESAGLIFILTIRIQKLWSKLVECVASIHAGVFAY